MTDLTAIIVTHGQPADPEPAAMALAGLAAGVAAHLPGWRIGSATLAEDGALARATASMPSGVIFPMFMAGGFFTRMAIPDRLRRGGVAGWRVLEPFGCDPAVHDLCVALAREAGAEEVLLAAHGSFASPVPAEIARHVAARVAAEIGLKADAAFIDQPPQLAAVQGYGPRAVCLPFFAAAGGHVITDVPAALAAAGFQGRVLPPVGLDARVPGIIAAAIAADVQVCSAACRWRR